MAAARSLSILLVAVLLVAGLAACEPAAPKACTLLTAKDLVSAGIASSIYSSADVSSGFNLTDGTSTACRWIWTVGPPSNEQGYTLELVDGGGHNAADFVSQVSTQQFFDQGASPVVTTKVTGLGDAADLVAQTGSTGSNSLVVLHGSNLFVLDGNNDSTPSAKLQKLAKLVIART